MYPTPRTLTPAQITQGSKFSFLAIPIWGLAMACIKTAIALTYLRVQSTKAWNVFLYSIIGIQVAYGIGNTFFILLECRPLRAAWDLSLPRSSCLGKTPLLVASNLGASINITTDILLSLAPLAFLHKLQRPLREKVMICLLMGMGLFASFASIMKAIVVREWGKGNTDPGAIIISICTWTILEQFLAAFAACAPSLKLPLQKFLGTFGITLTTYQQSYGRHSEFGPKGKTNLSRNQVDRKSVKSAFPSTASYTDLGPDDTIELGAAHAIKFPRKSAEGSGKSVAEVHSEEVPVHTV